MAANSEMKLYGRKNQTLEEEGERDKEERFKMPSWFLNKINQHVEHLRRVVVLQK